MERLNTPSASFIFPAPAALRRWNMGIFEKLASDPSQAPDAAAEAHGSTLSTDRLAPAAAIERAPSVLGK